MKIKRFKTILLILPALVLIRQPLGAQEFRGGIAFGYDISPKLNTEVEFQTRKLYDPEICYNRTTQARLEYSFSKMFQLAGSYSYSSLIMQTENYGEIENENSEKHKWAADLVVKPKRFDNDIRLTDRFRYQYATTNDEKTKEYLRNRLTVDYKISKAMQPYFAIEPYYNPDSKKIRFVRFYIGEEISVNHVKCELYYIAELDRKVKKHTEVQYIMGISFKINYKKDKQK